MLMGRSSPGALSIGWILFVAALVLFGGMPKAEADVLSIDIHQKQIPLSARNGSAVQDVGGLTYRGGVRLISPERRLGGLSGLIVSQDGSEFLSVSDQGDWVRGSLDYTDGRFIGARDVTIAPMLDEAGEALVHKQGDAEAIEQVDPNGTFPGTVIVSFERRHRLWRYDLTDQGFDALPVNVPVPAEIRTIKENQGIEALHVKPDGEIVALSEGALDDEGHTLGWRFKMSEAGRGSLDNRPLAIKTWKTFRPTDMTRLPDGRYLVLQRHFSPRTGPIIQLRNLGNDLSAENGPLEGSLMAQMGVAYNIDNMEGLASRLSEEGRILIYLISDDNFNPFQRTLLLMFEVMPVAVDKMPTEEPAIDVDEMDGDPKKPVEN